MDILHGGDVFFVATIIKGQLFCSRALSRPFVFTPCEFNTAMLGIHNIHVVFITLVDLSTPKDFVGGKDLLGSE